MNVNIIGTQYFPKCRVSTKSRLTKWLNSFLSSWMQVFVASVAPPSSKEETLFMTAKVKSWGYFEVRLMTSLRTKLCFSESMRPISVRMKSKVSWDFSCCDTKLKNKNRAVRYLDRFKRTIFKCSQGALQDNMGLHCHSTSGRLF